jgi:hypothetical protein
MGDMYREHNRGEDFSGTIQRMSTNFCIVRKNEEKSWKISPYVSCC